MHQVDATTGVRRTFWTRGKNNSLRIQFQTGLNVHLIATEHLGLATQSPEVTGEVVNERVVVVQQKNHRLPTWLCKLNLFDQFDNFIAIFVATNRSNRSNDVLITQVIVRINLDLRTIITLDGGRGANQ